MMSQSIPSRTINMATHGLLLCLLTTVAQSSITPPETPWMPRAPIGVTMGDEASVNPLALRLVDLNLQRYREQRALFQDARHALKRRDTGTYKRLAARLQEYPLLPYLEYERLQQNLGAASPDELNTFLERHANTPLADRLRDMALRYYSSRRRWTDYLAFYTGSENSRLQCYYARALLETGRETEAFEILPQLWLVGKPQSPNCDPVFERWKNSGNLGQEQIWARFALTMETQQSRLARHLADDLRGKMRESAEFWLKAQRNPELLLQVARYSHLPHASDIVATSLRAEARRDPARAAILADQIWDHEFLADQQRWNLAQAIGLALALKHQPDAERWFARTPASAQSDISREWRVRNALRFADWTTALDALDNLTSTQSVSERWTYWRAYTYEKLGQPEDAIVLYTELAQKRDFFGFLAADRLDLPYTLAHQSYPVSASNIHDLLQTGGIARAQELYLLGNITDARREWTRAVSGLDDSEKTHAARLAHLWGWHDRSILTVAGTSVSDDIELRFPVLYRDQVEQYSSKHNIEPAWSYSIIRRESAFITDARSPVGALGLMQLMPATAKRMSHKLRITLRDERQILNVDTNLRLGIGYLGTVLKEFNGRTVLATAAYNAGETNVRRWLPADSGMDAVRWIETIPFAETREYVRNVMAYTVIYQQRIGDGYTRISRALDAIPTREGLSAQGNI